MDHSSRGFEALHNRGCRAGLKPPVRISLMHRAIRIRVRLGTHREESHVRRQTRVSEDTLELAEARYASGELVHAIARNVGISRQRLASLLRKRGVRLRRATPSSAEAEEMARRYVDDESLQRVGTRTGYCAGTVRNYLLAKGVVLRDSHGRSR